MHPRGLSPARHRLVRNLAWIAVVMIAACLPAAASFGQTPDTSATAADQTRGTLPFRKGQWGAEATVVSGVALGVLRFTAPNRAWLLDIAIRGSGSSSTYPDGQRRKTASGSVRARVGRRGYRALVARTGSSSARAAAFGAFGGSVSGARGVTNSPYEGESWTIGVGLFVEAGGTAFVTDYLSLNAAVQADLEGLYASARYTNPDGTRFKAVDRQFQAQAGAIRIFASIFF